MKISLADKYLLQSEIDSIRELLKRQNQSIDDDLVQMWYLMDLVWDEYNCNNIKPNWENIIKFYSDPVWLLNGLFIEQHELSMIMRHNISDWIIKNHLNKIVDYGGGFGTLARCIAEKDNAIEVDIYEPHPSAFGLKRVADFDNINVIEKLKTDYDCLVCTDVLEHVPNPLIDFADMVKSVKLNGYLIIANCFHPVIQCHLPQHFHLRYSFNFFAKMMGLDLIGLLEGSHATIYKKMIEKEPDWGRIKYINIISQNIFPIKQTIDFMLRLVKK